MRRRDKIPYSFFALLVAAAVLTNGCASRRQLQVQPEKIQLQLRLKQGESYNLRMTTDQKITQTIMGREQQILQSIGIGYSFDVREVDSLGIARVDVVYHGVVFKQDAGGMGKFEYDSSDPPAEIPPMARGYAALVGQSFAMRISPDGHVFDVEGGDEMIADMLERIDLPEGRMKTALEDKLRDQFGNEGVEEMMDNMMAIYPDKPVGINDSWTSEVVETHGFPMILNNTWTLKERRDGIAVVEVSSEAEPNLDVDPIEMGPLKMRYELKGEQSGMLELNEATGWVTAAELNQKYSGDLVMDSGPMMENGEGMSIPISIEITIRLESF